MYIQDRSRPGLRGPFEVKDASLVYVGQPHLAWFLCGTPDKLDILLVNGAEFEEQDLFCIQNTTISIIY
jgi:hypothetical protein